MILGTLRQQLLYPYLEEELDDAELEAVLERVNLPDLVERSGGFDRELDFAKVLSVGEQQRLAIARALLARPAFAVLDEATSALDPENETRLYAELQSLKTTLISVTHHRGLIEQHGQVLEVIGDGTWRLSDTQRYVASTKGTAPDALPSRG